jgi:hypothetical protein
MLVRIGRHSSLAKDLATPRNPIGAELLRLSKLWAAILHTLARIAGRRWGAASSLARGEARAKRPPARNPIPILPGAG